MSAVNEKRHAFLQWMLQIGCVSEDETIKAFRRIYREPDGDVSSLRSALAVLRQKIKEFELEIVTVTMPDSSTFYCLITTSDDGIAQLHTDFSKHETEAFYHVIRTISGSKDFTLPTVDASNAISQAKVALTKLEVSNFLDRLIERHWLCRNELGVLSLGPRSLAELPTRLSNSGLFPVCDICMKIIAFGQFYECESESCTGSMHSVCYSTLMQAGASISCKKNGCGKEMVAPIN